MQNKVNHSDRYRQFIKEALAADKAMDAGADVYRPDDVHRWLERLARNGWAERPAPAQRIR